jgi:hypothetical protein
MDEMNVHTLCCPRSSLLRPADMMVRRSELGAWKCAFRAFLRDVEAVAVIVSGSRVI